MPISDYMAVLNCERAEEIYRMREQTAESERWCNIICNNHCEGHENYDVRMKFNISERSADASALLYGYFSVAFFFLSILDFNRFKNKSINNNCIGCAAEPSRHFHFILVLSNGDDDDDFGCEQNEGIFHREKKNKIKIFHNFERSLNVMLRVCLLFHRIN